MNKSNKELVEKYPECEKLANVSKESNAIGQFFDWLSEKNIVLFQWQDKRDNGEAKFVDEEGNPTFKVHSQFLFDDQPEMDILNPEYEILPEGYFRIYTPMEKLLAQYFNIDLNKVEKERRQMLDELQNGN